MTTTTNQTTTGGIAVKWYISGPISGYEIEERRKAFEKVEQLVKGVHGTNVVFNPIKNGLPEDAAYSDHMMRDLEALVECDIVIVMAGWQHSRGCLNELKFARRLNLQIIGENEVVNDELDKYITSHPLKPYLS